MAEIPERFPKVRSPYTRGDNQNDRYVVEGSSISTFEEIVGNSSIVDSLRDRFNFVDSHLPDLYVEDEFSWVFDRAEEVEAIEKLDGTNVAIHIDEHQHGGYYIDDVAVRYGDKSMNRCEHFGPDRNHHQVTRAVQNSKQRGYTDSLENKFGTGWFFGECVGPKFQGNPHELDESLFIPFDWLRNKCEYESYGKYDTDFESIRDWMQGEENGIFSLFASQMHGLDLRESRPDHGTFMEGIIAIHPDHEGPIRPSNLELDDNNYYATEIAKIRRDMFEGFIDWPMNEYGH